MAALSPVPRTRSPETPRTDGVLPRDALSIAAAYRHCERIARTHYENFTVGSWLLPRELRRHIAAIYAFARIADDIADEGDLGPPERHRKLDDWREALAECYRGRPTHPVLVALGQTARIFSLPISAFERLLDAFASDVDFRPFPTFEKLRAYCQNSADPVGHLVLGLFGYRDRERQALADRICTGLQLANFWQDLAIDARRGRTYVPLEDLARFGCSTADLRGSVVTPNLRRLLAFEVERARALVREGLPLAEVVEPRLAREVRLFAAGGLGILARIEAVDFDVFTRRPALSKAAKALLVARALLAAGRDGLRGGPSGPARTGAGDPTERAGTSSPSSLGPTVGEHAATLRAAYDFCRDVTQRSSTSFLHAFQLLPPPRRDALYAVYAFCRFVDDIVDDLPTPSPSSSGAVRRRDPAHLLTRWRHELDRVYDGRPTRPISIALADAVQRYRLDRRHFLDVIRGVEMDLRRRRYSSFDELHEYCRLVASAVGLLVIEIFGYKSESARRYAHDLGVAFQLTNILRDVMEDARRNRIYLPGDDLRRFGCSENDLLAGRSSAALAALMAFECGRARAYYLRARGALAAEDRRSLAPAEAMRMIYERLLERIAARPFDVFAPRVTVPSYEKLTLAFGGWARSRLTPVGA